MADGRAKPGNKLAVKHGVHTEPQAKAVRAKQDAIYDLLAAAAPVRGPDGDVHPADRFAVTMLAKVLCRLDAATAWVDEHGAWDRRGKIRSVARHELRLMTRAEKMMAALGLTPTARAKLGLDLARTADLATAMSEPDPAKRRLLLEQAGVDTEAGA